MILKQETSLSGNVGYYSISHGIPKGVYSEDQLDLLKKQNPKINVEKFMLDKDPSPVMKNKIVEVGKKELLNIVFETGGTPFKMMAIGDGGFNYATSSKIFPKNSDAALRSPIGQPKEITSFSAVTGDTITGFVKVLASTFFSEDYTESDFKSQNQVDFFVNEVGITTPNGILYSLLSFNNYPFDPKNQQALTIQWFIRSL